MAQQRARVPFAAPRAAPPAAAWAMAVLLSACASPPAASTDGGTDALAQVGRWTLQGATRADGADVAALAPHGMPVHAIVFDGTRVAVMGGCNEIGGAYRISQDGALVVEAMVSTKRACQDPARMQADAAVIALLEGHATWRIAESWPEQLFIDHDDGSRSHWTADRPASAYVRCRTYVPEQANENDGMTGDPHAA